MTIINNHGKFILLNSAKTGWMLSKNINNQYIDNNNDIDKYHTYDYDLNIDYNIYIFIRNPYHRIVSSFFAVTCLEDDSETSNIYKTFTKNYNNFTEFIDFIYKIHKEAKNKCNEKSIKINNITHHSNFNYLYKIFPEIKEKSNDKIMLLDNICETLYKYGIGHTINVASHVFHQCLSDSFILYENIASKYDDDSNKYIYSTSELNDFINDFNNKYKTNMVIGKHHSRFKQQIYDLKNEIKKLENNLNIKQNNTQLKQDIENQLKETKHVLNYLIQNKDDSNKDDNNEIYNHPLSEILKKKHIDSKYFYNDDIKRKVEEIFEQDFEMCKNFGYNFYNKL